MYIMECNSIHYRVLIAYIPYCPGYDMTTGKGVAWFDSTHCISLSDSSCICMVLDLYYKYIASFFDLTFSQKVISSGDPIFCCYKPSIVFRYAYPEVRVIIVWCLATHTQRKKFE